jgi:hypothetical protein
VQSCNAGRVNPFGIAEASKHRPDAVFSRVPSERGCHTWFAPPVQVRSSTWVPLAVPDPTGFKHFPDVGFTSGPDAAPLDCNCHT